MKKSKFSILLALSLSILLFYQCKNEQNSLVESSEIETKSNITKADTSKFQKLNFHINIDAPVDVVYKTVIDSNLFMDWTSAFGPGSYYKGNWEKGSKMIFCGSKQQIDKQIGKSSCIYDTMKLENSGLVGYITLKSNHRNPILTDIIEFLEKENDK